MKRCYKRLIKLALLLGAGAAVAKVISAKKEEWTGLTESEVRLKVETKLPDQVPEEKRTELTDKVVEKMKDRGLLAEVAEGEEVVEEVADVEAVEEAVADEGAEDEPAG